jgi:hypothetical protein
MAGLIKRFMQLFRKSPEKKLAEFSDRMFFRYLTHYAPPGERSMTPEEAWKYMRNPPWRV